MNGQTDATLDQLRGRRKGKESKALYAASLLALCVGMEEDKGLREPPE